MDLNYDFMKKYYMKVPRDSLLKHMLDITPIFFHVLNSWELCTKLSLDIPCILL